MTLIQKITAILLLLSTNIIAQNPIKGILLDSLHQPIEGATILIKTKTDSLILLSDASGKFETQLKTTDSIDIRINRMGFYPFHTKIPTPPNLLTITLKNRSTLLKEIVIRSTPTLTQIKGDTMQYNMDAIQLKPNSVAEDVLKILPGLFVDQEGNVYYKGKKVSAIKINGKSIAVNDIKDITKLFPADAIKSIQLINEYTPLDRITGRKLEPSTNVLNIQTSTKKGALFRGLAGGGTENKYIANAILNLLNGPSVTTIALTSNNTSPSANITVTNGNLNYASSLKSGLSLNAGSFFRILTNTNQSNSLTTTQSDRGTLQTMDNSTQRNDYKSINVRTSGEQLTNSLPVLSYAANYANQQSTLQSELLSTQTGFQHQVTETKRNSINNTQNLNGTLLLSHTSKNNKTILSNQLSASTSNNDNQLHEDNHIQFYNQDTIIGDSLIQRKTIKNATNTSLSEVSSLVYKFSTASSLELRYQLLLATNELKSNSYSQDSLAKDIKIDSLTTNNKFNSIQHRVNLNYKYSWKKTNLIFGANLVSDRLSLRVNSEQLLKRRYSFILPEARLELIPVDNRNLTIAYISDITEPSSDQINPVGDYSSPQTPIIGNPDLKPSQKHELSINYTSIGKYDIALNGAITYYVDNIVSKVEWVPNAYNNLIQATHFTNVNGVYAVRSHASFSRRLNENQWSLSLDGGAGYDHAITFIDGNRTINQVYQADPSFRITYSSKLLEIQPSITYVATVSDYKGFSDLHTFTSAISSSLHAKLSVGKWLLSLQTTKQYNYGFAQSLQTNPLNCNVYLDYRFAKDRITLKGSAINIFNQIQNNTQIVGAASVTQTGQVNPGRFFLLSVQVNLRNNKNPKNN